MPKKSKINVDTNTKYFVTYSMIKTEKNHMNELNCRVCEEPTACSEDAAAITCASCVNDAINNLNGVS